MIQMETVLNVADNSGPTRVKCIKVLGHSKKMVAGIGDVIVVSVVDVIPSSKIKRGSVRRALIVRTKFGIVRPDGSKIQFDDNAAVLLDKQSEPVGTRVEGAVTREIRHKGFVRIASLAAEVI